MIAIDQRLYKDSNLSINSAHAHLSALDAARERVGLHSTESETERERGESERRERVRERVSEWERVQSWTPFGCGRGVGQRA